MKKLILLIVIIAVGIWCVGCASKDVHEPREYPWSVILILKYEFDSKEIADKHLSSLIADMDKRFVAGDKKAFHQTWTTDKALQVELHFENYKEFQNYFGLTNDNKSVVDFKMDEEMFFIHRTQTFDNPWVILEDNSKMNAIQDNVTKYYAGLYAENTEVKKVYVFASSVRRSSMEGNYKVTQELGDYNYYYDASLEKIVIYDKFANQPMWYVVAVLGAFAFGGLVYLIYSMRRVKVE